MTVSGVEIGDGYLQSCRIGSPHQVGDVGVNHPAQVRRCLPNRDKRPNQGADHQQNIRSCQQVVFESELYRRKSQIEHEIKRKR